MQETAGFFRKTLFLLTIIVALVNGFAFFVYPGIREKVEHRILAQDQTRASINRAPELRKFQVANLTHEITLRNPETFLAWASACFLCLMVTQSFFHKNWAKAGLIVLNVAPLLIFSERFIPKSPIEQWHAILKGGPPQRTAKEIVGGELRMAEEAPGRREAALPGNTAIYYGVHTLTTFTGMALHPNGRTQVGREVNYLYSKQSGDDRAGRLLAKNPDKNVRYVWKEPNPRPVRIVKETLNTIILQIPGGPGGELIRTDTYYPGWLLAEPAGLALERDPDSGFYSVRIGSEATTIKLVYQPSGFRFAIALSLFGLLCTMLLSIIGSRAFIQRR